ncbi:conserved hypothetical protein [Streptomyces clavuligerus]|uniref:Uncharacterized protein n=1 Tax=Streptomyces clavuligerus TaxID=1901 RepID=Q6TMS5_STRCL|nr:hypothetical protein pSCL2.5.424.8 [Streptomyces clavuligerus]EDY48742.1 conserved hypothetical protein [Streptomyces clavuligerus]
MLLDRFTTVLLVPVRQLWSAPELQSAMNSWPKLALRHWSADSLYSW